MPEMTLQQAFDLAVQHHQAGRLNDAESIYRQILAVEPRHAGALHYLGVLAHQVDRNDLAVDLIGQSIALNPGDPAAHSNLGNIFREMGQVDEAIAACGRALVLQPEDSGALINLGNALKDKGQWQQAVDAYRQAIVLRPDSHDAHNNLGIALRLQGHLDDAIAAFRLAITLKPDSPVALGNLGGTLGEAGKLDESIATCRRAIALQPDLYEAHNSLGTALYQKGRLDKAVDAYRHAIALRPDFHEAHSNLGTALRDQGHLDKAIDAYRHAIALRPDFHEAHYNLGNALRDQGQLDKAVAAYRHAIALRPDLCVAHTNLVFCLNYDPSMNASAVAEEHRRWCRRHAQPLRTFIQPHGNNRSPDRRLRIGYVSPDFRKHSVAFFLEGLFENHDHSVVEVYGYSDVAKPDAVTGRLRGHVGHWRQISGLSDEQAAGLIRKDGIDILVDLAGHTANNRLLVFARKPAPVQVSWLGYSNKTWLETIDYRITDAIADPPENPEDPYGERLFRLTRTFACFRPAEDAPLVAPLPAAGCGRVTFASFHAVAKLNEELLEWWARILSKVPGSRLMLVAAGLDGPLARESFTAFFERRGIVAERLEFKGVQTLDRYLALHHEVDVLLDSHPFSGHTVSCNALWMGVPVVTLAGTTHRSRMVASVLGNLGLTELIAASPEEYVDLAVALAKDLPHLSELRSSLRERMKKSPLMDAAAFASDMEAAYREMWRKWCEQSESPPCQK